MSKRLPLATALASLLALPSGAQDRKSFTLIGAENWAWTYTPTLLQ